jgi:phospholipid/cholesterol/gamma-HCH transport system permease protein
MKQWGLFMPVSESATVRYEQSGQTLRMAISGRLDADTTSRIWPEALAKCDTILPEQLQVDASSIDYCDSAGIGLLLKLRDIQQGRNKNITIDGLKPEFSKLLTLFDPGQIAAPPAAGSLSRRIAEEVGRSAAAVVRDLVEEVNFIGELSVKMTESLLHPTRLRWQDAMLIAEKTGANAVGIVSLMGFLIGLILAFQSAVPMKLFGAEIFVADLVAISLFRELGPLITAVIVASRTGSSFAAEIGTMTVNEEVDALVTMGLDPVKFLVIPRVLSTTFVMPILAMFNSIVGLIGAGVLMVSIGFTPITYIQRVQLAVHPHDVIGGLVKTLVFGALIASIGCLRGLQTRRDASGVGDAATRAVVTGIVAIVVTDGVFAVLYYHLGI